ncbi:unnamed protein product [Closterium sp. Yama58-4]|nr:unnamed protein product [Closterium sp. Yama58-4]
MSATKEMSAETKKEKAKVIQEEKSVGKEKSVEKGKEKAEENQEKSIGKGKSVKKGKEKEKAAEKEKEKEKERRGRGIDHDPSGDGQGWVGEIKALLDTEINREQPPGEVAHNVGGNAGVDDDVIARARVEAMAF